MLQSDANGGATALLVLGAIALGVGTRAWIDRSSLAVYWFVALAIMTIYVAMYPVAEFAVAGLPWISAGLICLGGLGKCASDLGRVKIIAVCVTCLSLFVLPILIPFFCPAIAQTGPLSVLAAAISFPLKSATLRSVGWSISLMVAALASVVLAALSLDSPSGELTLSIAGVWLLAAAGQQRVAMLQRLALTDELTGLSNLRAFREAGARALAQLKRSHGASDLPSLLLVADLDGFKLINDREGHEAGDRALTAFAAMLHHELREGDLVARLGGDEFGMLLFGTDLQRSAGLVNRLTQATTALRVPGVSSSLTATFATAELTTNDGSIQDTLRRADIALYARKLARA